jgi:hypothetical protein
MNKYAKFFEIHNEEYMEFERVPIKLASRPDVHAFMLLDKLVPSKSRMDMVASAEHDEIYLEVDPKKLFAVAKDEEIIELIRCGVRYEEELDSFAMFV